jgi:2-haloacid dehalogenase
MPDRRDFLRLAGAAIAANAVFGAAHAAREAIRAIAFDAFPVLDPRPIGALAEKLFPGHGKELMAAWRTRQFEYQWLRALAHDYADFLVTTRDSLDYAAELLQLDLGAGQRTQLVDAHLHLAAWPDAPAALARLRDGGKRLAFLSNATPAMLAAGIRNSQLDGVFDKVLSSDAIRSYKPDPRVYAMAPAAFGLRKEQILYVAFAGWDAAGAKAFGYRTFWVNRLGLPAERLGAPIDGSGSSLDDLVRFVEAAG